MSSNKADLSADIRTPDRAEYPRSFSPSTPALLAETRQNEVHQVNVQPLATDRSTGRFRHNVPLNIDRNSQRSLPFVQLDEVFSVSDASVSSEEDDDIVFGPNVIDLCSPNRKSPESTSDITLAEKSAIKHSQPMCPICIAPMTVPTSTECGHVFCKACINRAVDTFKKCPLCNAKILKRHLRRIFL
ncbi:RING finger protein 10-like isoform X2 [Teleopsis dalmanni]|uniref:RING finger protein 10-like isoform X2 n=1 Tax=Teleopsis dalmanni TaxID=139649 RepID=UPI0018CCFA89|nr:RING finger protein 10-like isoform X2 [Teleopsis dalmanni]